MRSSTSSSEPTRTWRRYPLAGLTALLLFVCLDRWASFDRIQAWRAETHIPGDLSHLEIVAGFRLKPLKPREPGAPVIYIVGTSQADGALSRMAEVQDVDGRSVHVEDFASGYHDALRQMMVQPEIESPSPDVVVFMLGELDVCGDVPPFSGKNLQWNTGVLREYLATLPFERLAREVDQYEELALNSLSNLYRYRKHILWRLDDYPRWCRLEVPVADREGGGGGPAVEPSVSISRRFAAALVKGGFALLGPRYGLGERSPEEKRLLAKGPLERVPEPVSEYIHYYLKGLRSHRFRELSEGLWSFCIGYLGCVQYGPICENSMNYHEIMIRRWRAQGVKVVVMRGVISPDVRIMIHPEASSMVDDYLRSFCARLGARYFDLSDFKFDGADFLDPIHVIPHSPSARRFHDYVARKCLDVLDEKPAASKP